MTKRKRYALASAMAERHDSPNPPRIAIVHTSFLAVESFTQLFHELAPDVRVHHIVDDSVLP